MAPSTLTRPGVAARRLALPTLLAAVTALVTVAIAALSAFAAASAVARTDGAPAGTTPTVPFRYAVSAKRHGKHGTRLTRLVVRGVPDGSIFNVTCSPAGTGGCPASGTLPVRASTADDGTSTYRVVTKRLTNLPTGMVISLGASHADMAPRAVQLKVTRPGKIAVVRAR